jgi:hypothetical protein
MIRRLIGRQPELLLSARHPLAHVIRGLFPYIGSSALDTCLPLYPPKW